MYSLGAATLLLVSASFIFKAPSTAAQLLFPVNNQVTFGSDGLQSESSLRGSEREGAGALWIEDRVPRIAIIGAGAAGSSAAYFLHHFAGLEKHGLQSDVTIFESSSYVGGRSTVGWPWNDDPEVDPRPLGVSEDEEEEAPVELGASIFVDANKNLKKATRIFGLETIEHGGEEDGMAIWDGSEFSYHESRGWGYWNLAKMFWRYGRSPLWVQSLIKATVADFTELYSPSFASLGAFDSLYSFANATNLTSSASVTASDYFKSNSISPLFTNELIAAATAVNYGQPISTIHGLGALVSLAAQGAQAIKGGNRKLFEAFIGSSGARLRLGPTAKVEQIVKLDQNDGKRPQWIVRTPGGGGTFDAIIIASPFHQTGVSIINSAASKHIPPQAYVHLHVTFIITNASSPLPSYFDLPPKTSISKSIFATFDTASEKKPTFNSLNYLKALSPSISLRFDPSGESVYHVIKMFSAASLSPEELEKIFGEGNVGKVWRKEWDAYPQLEPIGTEEEGKLARVRVDEGLYYVNGFERLISTMETETVASWNVVSLMMRDFFGYATRSSWAEWGVEE